MRPLQIAVSVILFATAVVQTSAQTPAVSNAPAVSNTPAPGAEAPISVTVTNIVAPVLVTDRSGNIIDGLQPSQFRLFDNGKEQNIQVDVAFEPISLVVLIEKAARVESILPQIKHLGTLLPLVVGDHGEAAVLAFDSRLALLQDFTPDPDKVKAAIDKINAGSSSSRMIDAVDQAVAMLKKRPADNRKIILLVSETRDNGSEGRVRETLIDAQLANVLVYTVDITQLAVRLTEKPTPPRPNPIAIAATPGVMGQPSTPTTDAQNYGPGLAQFGPVLAEIYKDTKRLFVDSPSEVFAKGTGGDEYFFLKQKGLEDAVQRISQEIRSQYLISYNPNNKDEPGFHALAVTVDNPRDIAKTRPGYWIGGGKVQ
ncbi:MAG: VWA domain-containing protein [Bryobacteraceae bacterium]|jgi:VWFA-related protein